MLVRKPCWCADAEAGHCEQAALLLPAGGAMSPSLHQRSTKRAQMLYFLPGVFTAGSLYRSSLASASDEPNQQPLLRRRQQILRLPRCLLTFTHCN